MAEQLQLKACHARKHYTALSQAVMQLGAKAACSGTYLSHTVQPLWRHNRRRSHNHTKIQCHCKLQHAAGQKVPMPLSSAQPYSAAHCAAQLSTGICTAVLHKSLACTVHIHTSMHSFVIMLQPSVQPLSHSRQVRLTVGHRRWLYFNHNQAQSLNVQRNAQSILKPSAYEYIRDGHSPIACLMQHYAWW